jgi:antitoxin YefM
MTTLPLTEAKARLNELVEEAVATHERVTITRHGRPAAVLISVDDLESLEETLFWQSQRGVHDDIEAARDEKSEGALHDETSVRQRYGLRTTR